MFVEEIHISQVRPGDTVEHLGHLRTVGQKDIRKDNFFGTQLFGDSYKLGRDKVRRVTLGLSSREFDIVQRADGIQYACINAQAVFFRAHRSGTWVRTSVKPELEYFTPAGTERITDADTNAPIFTGHNLAEISAYFKG